jgi:protein-tyrosine phosphatase
MVAGLLFVCHANLCRSPMAEFIARDMLAERLGAAQRSISVSSAGTHALPGRRMHPYAAELAAERGTDPDAFRSRPLTADDIASAGLILTATRRQRSACVALAPAAIRRTFTLRQFARLAAAAAIHGWPAPHADRQPAGRLDAALRAAALARGRLQPAGPDADDLPDPIGSPIAEFRACAREVESALTPMVELIAASE